MRRLIGAGSSAEVFAIAPDRALKLFYESIAKGHAAREFSGASVAHAAGLSVAKPIALIEEQGRHGIVFERIFGRTLFEKIMRNPFLMWPSIWRLVAYQRKIHRCAIDTELPHVHDLVRQRLSANRADATLVEAAGALLARLPRGDRLGHGDLHPGNLIAADHGLVAIDWGKSWVGPPAADIARSEMLIKFGLDLTRRGAATPAIARSISSWWYRRCYRPDGGVSASEIDAWRFVLGVAWLGAEGTKDNRKLLKAVRRWHHRARTIG